MHRVDDRLILSPTDLTKHLACHHITSLDLDGSKGGTGNAGAPRQVKSCAGMASHVRGYTPKGGGFAASPVHWSAVLLAIRVGARLP